jgi:hypothetical protein
MLILKIVPEGFEMVTAEPFCTSVATLFVKDAPFL